MKSLPRTGDNLTVEINYTITGNVDVTTIDNILNIIPHKVYHEFTTFHNNIANACKKADFCTAVYLEDFQQTRATWETMVRTYKSDQPVCRIRVILRVSNHKSSGLKAYEAYRYRKIFRTLYEFFRRKRCRKWVLDKITVNQNDAKDYEDALIQVQSFLAKLNRNHRI